jgi:hypothetical protein
LDRSPSILQRFAFFAEVALLARGLVSLRSLVVEIEEGPGEVVVVAAFSQGVVNISRVASA